jgi:hypothetical protein
MKNRDIISFKLQEILEKEPLMGRLLEDMAMRTVWAKDSNLAGDKAVVDMLLNSLVKDFEMMGIEEDRSTKLEEYVLLKEGMNVYLDKTRG